MAICLSEKLWIGLLLLDGGQGQSSYEVDTVDTETKENITFPTLGLWVSQRRRGDKTTSGGEKLAILTPGILDMS